MPALGASAREELLSALARHTRADAEPFVARPMVLPTKAFFPDVWAPTEAGLDALAERLLAHAGLSISAEVTLAADAIDESALLPETAIDLAGVEGATAFFTVTRLGRAEDACIALAHEVCRAARMVRAPTPESYREAPGSGFVEPEDDEDARWEASILGVYLGLGALGAIGAHDYRQTSRMEGRSTVTAWTNVVYGGLSPEAASFLVAVQLRVREVEGEREAVLAALPEARRDEVLRELDDLDRETLVAALGLPAPASWPGARAPAPLAPASDRARRKPRKRKKRSARKGSRVIAFRCAQRRLALGGVLGTVLGAGATFLVGGIAHHPFALAVFVLAPIVGSWMGWSSRTWECSACERDVADGAEVCRACGASLVGEIEHRSQRLAAEEAWERDRRRHRR